MGLWRHPDFLKFWCGQTISLLGSQVSTLALGLTAAVLLQATAVEMGILGMLQSVPFLLFGLPAGVWADRVRRRPMLIASDIGRAALLASVPIAALLGVLGMRQMYVVAFGMGSLNVIFNVAYGSFLPAVIERDQLQEGNTKLALAEAISRVSGPGLAGVLVQVMTAPLAIVVDALSFLASALSLVLIRAHESPVNGSSRSVWLEIREGLAAVFGHRLLRPLLIGSNLGNLSDGVQFSSGVALLFMVRELHFEPAVLGAVLSGLGIGGLIGAVLNGPVYRALGPGRTIVGSMGLWAIGCLGLALVPDSPWAPLLFALFLGTLGAINPIAGATVSTLRQVVTPDRLLGRVTAVVRVGTWGCIAVGALVGGILADSIGLRATLIVGALLPLLGLLWLAVSPIMGLRSLDSYAVACSEES